MKLVQYRLQWWVILLSVSNYYQIIAETLVQSSLGVERRQLLNIACKSLA